MSAPPCPKECLSKLRIVRVVASIVAPVGKQMTAVEALGDSCKVIVQARVSGAWVGWWVVKR